MAYLSTSAVVREGKPVIGSVASEGAAERLRDAESGTRTHFGFRDVAEEEKESLVGGVFSSVASSYDLMNDAMSLGIHRLWKDRFVSQLDPRGGINCLDVAGGTGDIARRILDHARTKYNDRQIKVTILDINAKMLRAGQKSMAQTMYWNTAQLAFQLGNAEDLASSTPPDFEGQLSKATPPKSSALPRNSPAMPALPTVPIADNSVDLYTIAFGIRNCTHVDQVLREAHRVLKPGGIFACLEFGKVSLPILADIYRGYSFNVIPSLGQILAGDRASYQYLVESIERFPTQPNFARMMKSAGFYLPGSPEASQWGLHSLGGSTGRAEDEDVQGAWEDQTFGIATIWQG
jgi:2-methoxy-6-polyprenyl-1,4-benzoquinol methylase